MFNFLINKSAPCRLFFLLGLLWPIQCSATVEFLPLPGALELPADVRMAIDQTWQERDSDHEVRSHHLYADGTPHYANRLLLELSPYLNQHAHNPVNWFAWGGEAFAQAKQQDRPVLISIGYSSCHWCHVMERESYDNLTIAQIMNERYVAIKVDRESNPDVDDLYMLAVQVMGGNGGWPLHVFVSPQGKPFLGVTYVPPGDFEAMLIEVHQVWERQRAEIESLASQITDQIQNFGAPPDSDIDLGKTQVDQFISVLFEQEQLIDEFSPPTSSFPFESELFLLLDSAFRYGNETALHLAENRLTNMARGGIRDHVGGGFHRYSIDNEWLVPHFEKMLYNQAHLARTYIKAFELTGKDLYRRVAQQTLDYVLRDMRGENGEFWSATDADSEGEEGRFFVWTKDEIAESIGDDADFVIDHYSVTESGNFDGRNILFLADLPETRAANQGTSLKEYLERLAAAVEKLRIARERRVKPYLDDKIITAWNAMMITALADSWSVFKNERYLAGARVAAQYLWTHAWREHESRLYRILRDGQLGEAGKLRDYAYLSEALLTLYDATADQIWLDRARILVDVMIERFWDKHQGGFFSVSEDDAQGLIARQKDRFDEALPSGNSVAARSLSMLYERTGQQIYLHLAEQLFQVFATEIALFPTSFGYALKALEETRGGMMGSGDYAASGHAKLSVQMLEQRLGKTHALVELTLADGWHIQSDQPLADNLFATQITSASQGWRLDRVDYPSADEVSLSFQNQPVSVFSGTLQIPVELTPQGESGHILQLDVQLQACNDTVCLLPETVSLEIPLTQITG